MTLEEQLQSVINGVVTDIQGIHDEPLVREPNYSNSQTKTWGSTYTADADGWLYADAKWDSGGNATITIDGFAVIVHGGGVENVRTSEFIPIKSGSTYKTSGGSSPNIIFIPSITTT